MNKQKKKVSIDFNPEIYNRLKEWSKHYGLSNSDIVNSAIGTYLNMPDTIRTELYRMYATKRQELLKVTKEMSGFEALCIAKEIEELEEAMEFISQCSKASNKKSEKGDVSHAFNA